MRPGRRPCARRRSRGRLHNSMGDTQFLNRSVVGDRDRRAAVTNSGFEDADEAGDLG